MLYKRVHILHWLDRNAFAPNYQKYDFKNILNTVTANQFTEYQAE